VTDQQTALRSPTIRQLASTVARIVDELAPLPDYQGVNTRLAVRLLVAVVYVPLTIIVELKHAPIWQHLYVLLYPLTFCAFFEWWAVRRSGLTFSEEKLTLKYGSFYRFIPWSRVNSVEWRAIGNFESLSIRLDGSKRLALPMIWRIRGGRPTQLGSLNLCLRAGGEVDAVTRIEQARLSARRHKEATPHRTAGVLNP
jgi:hypothetical protein